MPDTIAKRAVLVFDSRLREIQLVNSFNSDAGLNVFRGKRSFSTENLAVYPALLSVFSPTKDTEEENSDRNDVEMIVYVEFHALPVSPENPYDTAEDVLGDIKTAVELADRTLGGLVVNVTRSAETVEMPADSLSTVSGRLEYTVTYADLYGKPYDETLGA